MLNIKDTLAPLLQIVLPGCIVKHADGFLTVAWMGLSVKNYALTVLFD